MKKPSKRPPLPIIGWREWLALPDLGIPAIKAKIDTGARTSSIHAFEIETYHRRGKRYARFHICPRQRDLGFTIPVACRVSDERIVRNSGGSPERRLVIVTDVELLGERWPIELTLARRDEMGFRMLLGREAIRRRFLVDPGRSYRNGR